MTTLAGSATIRGGDGCTAKLIDAKAITKSANELYVVDVDRVRKIVLN